ncbi:hypothetical protein [Rudaeicoccus suwonensis]|uniref:Uncharacterized protein n=1 Tax=Rudaeicoccus suwonensis TaxID=657409 RepID=A0A561E0R7_9MICO|nr:hypothetical protein [Rudaeicoccus suwonensis]TWE09228.1 hypothetical protein BKA23_2928 [Rudaeicoccus suwonensis]
MPSAADFPVTAATSAPTDAAEREQRLRDWRDDRLQRDPKVSALSDWDIRRLAESGAFTADEIRAESARLNAAALVRDHADDIAAALAARDAAHSSDVVSSQVISPETAATASDRDTGPWLPTGSFVPHQFNSPLDPRAVLPGIQIDDEDGALRLQWRPAEHLPGTVIYRVIEDTREWPRGTPDDAHTLGVTSATDITTTRIRPQGAVTYLAVWAYTGADEAAARAAEGEVIAQGEIIWPATGVSLVVTDRDTVVGRVEAPPGVRLVVQRFQADEPVHNDPSRALTSAVVESSGFHDRSPKLAVDLTYAVFVEAVLPDGQTRVSDRYVSADTRVDPAPVWIELDVRESATAPGAWDVHWADPGFGSVEVYLSDEPLPPGLSDGPRSRSTLERSRLLPEHRLPNYIARTQDGCLLQECYLKPDWTRSYFTVVHVVSDEQVQVGATVGKVMPAAPRDVRLVERVDSKILTFDWPRGVSLVEVHQGLIGHPPVSFDDARDLIGTMDSVQNYLRRGGLQITRPLPAIGCALHVVGVIYEQGQAVRSAPTTIEYPGLCRVQYRIVAGRADGVVPSEQFPADQARFEIFADNDLQELALCAVANPNRLPLHPGDGTHLADAVIAVAAKTEVVPFVLSLKQSSAHVRVFVSDRALAGKVALLDPPLPSMWVPVV